MHARDKRYASTHVGENDIADMDIAGPLQSCVHLADARGGSAMDRTRPALPLLSRLPYPRLAASDIRATRGTSSPLASPFPPPKFRISSSG